MKNKMPQKSIKITETQLNKLRGEFPKIGVITKPSSEYELYRGIVNGTTLVVYKGKKGITLQFQNTIKGVEDKINQILQIKQTTLPPFSIDRKDKEKQRIIEIDDTGWGDLIGSVFIVGRDVKTDNYIVREIPVKFFQIPEFEQKRCYKEAIRCVTEILNEFNANPEDTFIHICTGAIFSRVYKFLEEKGYSYEYSKIAGKTQDLAENIFNEYLSKTGCPRGYKQMKKWLHEDYETRIKYAKTGWKEFEE